MYICKKWHERLFVLKRKHIKEKTARIPIFFAPITKENAPLVRELRGQGIYPALITALMQKESETDTFYIAVERGNESSERGLKKVGFTFVGEYGFWRILKKTLNKALLRKDMTP